MQHYDIPRKAIGTAHELAQSELREFFSLLIDYEQDIRRCHALGNRPLISTNPCPWKDVYALCIHLQNEETLVEDSVIARRAVQLMTGLQELSLVLSFRAHAHAVECVASWWQNVECPIRKLRIYDGRCCVYAAPSPPHLADAREQLLFPEFTVEGMWPCLLSSDGILPWSPSSQWRRAMRGFPQLRALTIQSLNQITPPTPTSLLDPTPPESNRGPTHRFIRNLAQDCPRLRRVYIQSLTSRDAVPRLYFIQDERPPHRTFLPFPNQKSDLEHWYDPSPLRPFNPHYPLEMTPDMEGDCRDLDEENQWSAFLRTASQAFDRYTSGPQSYGLCDRCAGV